MISICNINKSFERYIHDQNSLMVAFRYLHHRLTRSCWVCCDT